MRFVGTALLLTLFLLPMSVGPVRAGFDEGVAAYEREDYAFALREFMPLARGGDGYRYGSRLRSVFRNPAPGLGLPYHAEVTKSQAS